MGENLKWITRQYVHVDRTACPWLIKKFIDEKAEFIFAPTYMVEEIAAKEQATPYDTKGAELGHHGEKCSFDAFVEKYNLKDPALLEVARIVRAADTDKLSSVPEAAGLEAIMTGISMQAKDDYEAIKNASQIYDALYANCKLRIIKEKQSSEIKMIEPQKRREYLKMKLTEQTNN